MVILTIAAAFLRFRCVFASTTTDLTGLLMNPSLNHDAGTRCMPVRKRHAPRRWRVMHVAALLGGLILFDGSAIAQARAAQPTDTAAAVAPQSKESRMWMTVGEHRFTVTLASTEAARAFVALLPLTIDMPDLNNNEKHATLPSALPTTTIRPGTIHSGDLMLYGAQTLVVFYQTFDSVYSYTRLGRVDDPTRLARVLGSGTARIKFSTR